jgi:hypothetical protein
MAPVPEMSAESGHVGYGEVVTWKPEKPRLSVVRFAVG